MNALLGLAMDCTVITGGVMGLELSARVWAWAYRDGDCPEWLLGIAEWFGVWTHIDGAKFVVRSDDESSQTSEQETETTCFRPSRTRPARPSRNGAAGTGPSQSRSLTVGKASRSS